MALFDVVIIGAGAAGLHQQLMPRETATRLSW